LRASGNRQSCGAEVGQRPTEALCDPKEPLDSTPEESRQLPDKGHLFNTLLTAMVLAGQGVFLLCDIFGPRALRLAPMWKGLGCRRRMRGRGEIPAAAGRFRTLCG
jgi:hypothetical protein